MARIAYCTWVAWIRTIHKAMEMEWTNSLRYSTAAKIRIIAKRKNKQKRKEGEGKLEARKRNFESSAALSPEKRELMKRHGGETGPAKDKHLSAVSPRA